MPLAYPILVYTGCLLLAVIIGYAIRRGSTCAVGAVSELVLKRRARRFMSFLLCSAVVTLVLLPAVWLLPGRGGLLLPSYSAAWTSALGGALFGVGAVVNGACNFGTIDKLGCGETRYLFLFPGLLAGTSMGRVVEVPTPVATTSIISDVSPVSLTWVAVCLAMAAIFWMASIRRKRARGTPGKPVAAYLSIIGGLGALITFAVGPWHYTRIAIEGSSMPSFASLAALGPMIGLLGALITGAVIAAAQDKRFQLRAPTLGGSIACFLGGFLMGVAILLIPGGNDGMVLSGLPSLSPSAAVAYPAMCATIALLVWATNRRHKAAAAD
ncbi:MAG: YeeE/YedE thiosulfate transporter family protein [Pseudomonadota bacterium]